MIRYTLISLLLFNCTIIIGQSINAILFVNERVIDEGISDLNVNITNDLGQEKYPISYYPGELIFGDGNWAKMVSDKTSQITISFDYNQFGKRNKHTITQLSLIHI